MQVRLCLPFSYFFHIVKASGWMAYFSLPLTSSLLLFLPWDLENTWSVLKLSLNLACCCTVWFLGFSSNLLCFILVFRFFAVIILCKVDPTAGLTHSVKSLVSPGSQSLQLLENGHMSPWGCSPAPASGTGHFPHAQPSRFHP